jgi:hypothetical protein
MGRVVITVTVLVAGAEEETLSCAGEKVQLAARGRVVQARVTVPLKLLVGRALTVKVVEEPAVTVAADIEEEKPKFAVPVGVGLGIMAPRRPCFSLARPAAK